MEARQKRNHRGNTSMKNFSSKHAVFGLFFLANFLTPASAGVFPLPEGNDSLIGEYRTAIAKHEDTLVDIARANDLGYDEIVNANPSVDVWLPREGTVVTLPHRYLLPDAPREGIVVNVAEMRLYVYPKTKPGQSGVVESYPISIGRSDWNTPLVTTKVTRKMKNPVWYPPKSVRDEHAQEGDPLPAVVKSGPDNPLGLHALYLGIPAYLIHGTNREYGIGMQVTHGCMRMYPEDIEHLYNTVKIGTPLRIVNQPYKVGWSEGTLFLEVHPWLEGTPEAQRNDRSILINLINKVLKDYPEYPVDWQAVDVMRIEANGLPAPIGPRMVPITSSITNPLPNPDSESAPITSPDAIPDIPSETIF
jgi:L,D-transpeptidase ErfK/SrfK